MHFIQMKKTIPKNYQENYLYAVQKQKPKKKI